jgi:Cu+-exporting ATPase
MLAAAAMALSSLSVVGNANRLRRWHPIPLPPADHVDVTPVVHTGNQTPSRDHTRNDHPSHQHGGHDDGGRRGGGGVDPVCGMTIDPASAAAHREVGDRTVYFCSTHCAAMFDADPDRYTPVR